MCAKPPPMKRILVVEDDLVLQGAIKLVLEWEGYLVSCAADGQEALDQLRCGNRPDVILLDWMLPGISGIEVCRLLRARSETRDVPIIMLTAKSEETEKVRGLSTGADDYIVKPFSVPELLARVRSILKRVNPTAVAEKGLTI